MAKPSDSDDPALEQSETEEQKSSWLPGWLIVLLVAVVYTPALSAGFIWDDDDYVTENPQLRTAEGLAEIWFEPEKTPQYYPLVHTTFWIEYALWELSPSGYHFNNILLHGLAAMFLWRVLRKLKLPGAWFAAALFAVHPVEVESVAWVTERKNVLSAFMYMMSALAYLNFTGIDGASEERNWKFYGLSLLCFLGALLSKTVTASLPGAILVVFWWKRGSLKLRDFVPLIPFFAIGASAGLFTAYWESTHVGAEGADWDLSWLERFMVAGRISLFYVTKILWPHPLAFIYPRWDVSSSQPLQYFFPLAVVGILATTWIMRNRIGRGWLAAFLFLGGSLFPALGFLNVYPMRFSYVADHFQYIAGVGVFALLGAGFHRFWHHENPFAIKNVAIVAIYLVLSTITYRQISSYKDLETLWRDTMRKNPGAWIAHNNLGILLRDRGDVAEAEACYREAIRLLPKFVDARNNLGNVLLERGDVDEALVLYREAIEFDPENVRVNINLASALMEKGQYDEALEYANKANGMAPDHPDFLYKRGSIYWRMRNVEAARADFERSVELDPKHAKARSNLGLVHALDGDYHTAIRLFHQALETEPDSVETLGALSNALIRLKRHDEAVEQLKKLIKVDPQNEMAIRLLRQAGQLPVPGGTPQRKQ